MTDDLVKRLLDIASPLADEAAGTIHRLTAERDRFQRAFAAQSAKVQIALDVGGEPVRAAFNTRKEVMPSEPNGSAERTRNIGPGDQDAVAGAAPEREVFAIIRSDGSVDVWLDPAEPGIKQVRADIVKAQIDAAVAVERERCAKRFAAHDCIRMAEYAYGWRHDVYDAIRKGDQP